MVLFYDDCREKTTYFDNVIHCCISTVITTGNWGERIYVTMYTSDFATHPAKLTRYFTSLPPVPFGWYCLSQSPWKGKGLVSEPLTSAKSSMNNSLTSSINILNSFEMNNCKNLRLLSCLLLSLNTNIMIRTTLLLDF